MKKASMTVFLEKPFDQSIKSASVVSRALTELLLSQIIKSNTIVYDDAKLLPPSEERQIFDMDDLFSHTLGTAASTRAPTGQQFENKWMIRYVLDKATLINCGYGPKEVARILERIIDPQMGRVWASEYNMTEWIIRIKLYCIGEMVSRATTFKDANMIAKTILSRVQTHLVNKVCLSGIVGIKKTSIGKLKETKYCPTTGACVQIDQCVLDTEGSNLLDTLNLRGVDTNRTYSNDIHEIYDLFGIEAANHVLFSEIKIILSFDGTYINDRHLALIVNTITHGGQLTSMTRHGIHKIKGFLVRCSYEEQVDVLLEAACYAVKDPCAGVTENIIFGQMAPVGTGTFDVIDAKVLNVHDDFRDVKEISSSLDSGTSLEDLLDKILMNGPSQVCKTNIVENVEPMDWHAPTTKQAAAKNITGDLPNNNLLMEMEQLCDQYMDEGTDGNSSSNINSRKPVTVQQYRPSSPNFDDMDTGDICHVSLLSGDELPPIGQTNTANSVFVEHSSLYKSDGRVDYELLASLMNQ